MKTTQIGSFTVFTNIDYTELDFANSNGECEQMISSALNHYFQQRFDSIEAPYDIRINKTETRLGCVITTLTIAAIAGGAYKVITDYDKLKKNIREIVKDAKSLYVMIKRKITGIKRKPKELPEGITDDMELEAVIDVYYELPEKYKKMFHTKRITITQDRSLTTVHSTALMREDLIEDVNEGSVNTGETKETNKAGVKNIAEKKLNNPAVKKNSATPKKKAAKKVIKKSGQKRTTA